ncbi:MAG: sulfonate transport system ATP-binding protein [Thermomicrobiales bacterium]|jgi:ABC-type nitrate/sulfonate/bicarbonate transport system ATPase subunit|nr:sulfonate transport system ATP-binding protein [Thermomicrobiales bacterium]
MAEPVALARVGKQFRRGQESLPVLNHVDLQVRAGEFVAVLGPSGCGKSTLLRLIAGLDRPTSGAVTLAEQVVTEADPRCAVVFQEPRLFPWKTIAANVAVGARRVKEKPSTETWLGRVGLSGFGGSFPHQLSGGMAQRAALARALIGHPGVLLLDEPFASLDALTRMQMQDLLADVCAQVRPTVVMVTHDVDEALHLADRIVLMSHRPSTIVSTITLDQPRPRQRGDASLAPLRAQILTHFGFGTPHVPTHAGAQAGLNQPLAASR